MRKLLPLILTIIAPRAFSQCTWPATLQAIGNTYCLGTTLSVNSTYALSTITWYQDGNPVLTTKSSAPTMAFTTAAGDQQLPFDLVGQYGLTDINSIFVTDKGEIYIVGIGTSYAVYKWTATTGWTIAAGGNSQGSAANQLGGSYKSILVDQTGNLFISDLENERVTKWAPGATSGVTVAGDPGGQVGSDLAHLDAPYGITMDCNGDLIIADAGNNRVLRWTPGAASGTVVAGGNGTLPYRAANTLSGPTAVGHDAAGNIYVADHGNARIVKWAPGASSGTTIAEGSNSTADDKNFPDGPSSLWVDGYGACYFTNYTSENRYVEWPVGATIGTDLTAGIPALAFDAFVDNQGNIWGWVTKDNRLRMIKRSQSIAATYKPTAPGRYWAVVTDVNGYTTNTDTIPVSNPPSGPPTISITATATTIGLCTPVTFTATTTNAGLNPAYQWQISSLDVGTNSDTYTNNIFGNGDRVDCILTALGQNCRLVHDTSNIIVLTVDPENHATVSITASDTATCVGTPIEFTATVINGAANPGLQWYVNGSPTGDTNPQFIDSAVGRQVVYCEITSDATCGLARSNSIPVVVDPLPVIPPDQVFYLPYGKGQTIDPVIDGDISQYLWTPGTGLSDSTIDNPYLTATESRTYTLEVTSPGGCKTSALIKIDVFTPLNLPTAFSPNGDGHNDLFYVLGGPPNSTIRAMIIYDRWGQQLFAVHNGVPGDPRFGWNGYTNGRPAAPGTYVYIVVMDTPGAGEKVYKGTLVLIR